LNMNPKNITRNRKMYTLPFSAAVVILVLFLSQIQFVEAQQAAGSNYEIFTSGPSRSTIPANAVYTRETRIGSFRPGYQEWGCPVFRVPATETQQMVTVTNTSSGRVETWPIPTYAVPANAADGHMCVVHLGTNTVYEFFEAVWTGSRTISAGGMVAFPMNANGISNPTHRRVTAAGFANMFGMIKREDFINPATGQLDPNNTVLDHALTMNLPSAILGHDTYVSPAVGGEVSGNSSNGIPMGALFALPRSLNVDTLNVHPAVRTILRAARDYGLYVADGTGTANYNGNYTATIEMEPMLLATLYGGSTNDAYLETIQSQVYAVISQYGIYRVTAGTGPIPTVTVPPVLTATTVFTSTPRPTNTPTFTPTIRPTNTVVPPTSTPRPTNTVVPPTSTPRPTNTPVPPTSTPRPTNTPIGPTPRPTDIGGGQDLTPTLPPTNTPVPTNTVVPSSTPRPTLPPTNTPVPTIRPTNTVVPPTSTPRPTNTVVPPTSTPRPTNTVVPPTSTPRPTNTPVPTSTANPTGLGVSIVVPSTIYSGSNFTVNIRLNSPNLAAGGGVDAFQVECTAGPSGRLTGRSITSGTVFRPNPTIVTQTNLAGTWMLYAVSQSGTNPPVTVGGTVLSISLRANSRGSANITCIGEIITANGSIVTLNIPVASFTVR
jgi:hypothetical protein